jgi:hypothetical protein
MRQPVGTEATEHKAEESMASEAITRQMVKTNWENLMCAVVNCWMCELAIALKLLVITICRSPINPITNPNPVHSHLSQRKGKSSKLQSSWEGPYRVVTQLMMWCTGFSGTLEQGWWSYTWTGSHLIRQPLGTSSPKEGAVGQVGKQQHTALSTKKETEVPAPARHWSAICQDTYHRHIPSEKKKRWYTCRLLGTNSLKMGDVWHVRWEPK